VSKKDKTFAKDDVLPKLPVPELKDTIRKYLESVRPHVDAAAFQKTQAIAKEFENGVGVKLHRLLLERAQKETNWVTLNLVRDFIINLKRVHLIISQS